MIRRLCLYGIVAGVFALFFYAPSITLSLTEYLEKAGFGRVRATRTVVNSGGEAHRQYKVYLIIDPRVLRRCWTALEDCYSADEWCRCMRGDAGRVRVDPDRVLARVIVRNDGIAWLECAPAKHRFECGAFQEFVRKFLQTREPRESARAE